MGLFFLFIRFYCLFILIFTVSLYWSLMSLFIDLYYVSLLVLIFSFSLYSNLLSFYLSFYCLFIGLRFLSIDFFPLYWNLLCFCIGLLLSLFIGLYAALPGFVLLLINLSFLLCVIFSCIFFPSSSSSSRVRHAPRLTALFSLPRAPCPVPRAGDNT